MNQFILFKHKSNGVVKSYPAHYATHPVFGEDLEVYVPEEYEEDKVVVENNHELPVDQRVQIVAVPLAELTKPELVALAEEHGLDSKGTKDELIDRLVADNTKDN